MRDNSFALSFFSAFLLLMSIVALLRSFVNPARANGAGALAPCSANYHRLADETGANLKEHVLAKWFPQAVDRALGGFHENYGQDWKPLPGNGRSLVYQARLTWTAAQAAMHDCAGADLYLDAARHGLRFLAEHLWDAEHGGLFWGLDGGGRPERSGEKHVYGMAFGIYAASACCTALKDPGALDLAARAFAWLEQNAHDMLHEGYDEALTREGRSILTPSAAAQTDAIGTRCGLKSANTHLHLLEAFTTLYAIWPDELLRRRLQEVFHLVRDKIAAPPGTLGLFFTPDWTPVPGHGSFGHDVEAAFLLAEAAGALGMKEDETTWTLGRKFVDHALEAGWDADRGGFFDKAHRFGAPFDTDKIWWVEAEGLNALLLLHVRCGHETARYWDAFTHLWSFITTYQVDQRHGGWYPAVSRKGSPRRRRRKSDSWTECYHQGRALMRVSSALRHLAAQDGERSLNP